MLYVTGCRITQVPLYILMFPQSWRVQVVQVKNIQFLLHVLSKRIMIEMQSAYNIEKAGALHNLQKIFKLISFFFILKDLLR